MSTLSPSDIADAADLANLMPVGKSADSPEVAEYRKRDNQIHDEFARNLAAKYLPGVAEPVTLNVYARSWTSGNGRGFGQIERDYRDLAALVLMVQQFTLPIQ